MIVFWDQRYDKKMNLQIIGLKYYSYSYKIVEIEKSNVAFPVPALEK
jgi:hypothetical protein